MLNYILLGIIQGIFEWLPISSEGIVAITSNFLVKKINPIDTALFLHLGTMFVTIIYFRKEFKKIVLFKDRKMLIFFGITSIVSLPVGFIFYKIVRNLTIGPVLLLVTGIGLLATAYFHKYKRSIMLDFNENRNTLAVITGLFQGLAAIPGLSRSGATIFSLSLSNSTPKEILKISYIVSVPVILALSMYLLLVNPAIIESWPSLVSSFITGALTLHILMKLSEKINFFTFSIVFAVLCFIGGIIGILI